MGPLALAGIQGAVSAIPLLFGENNIFSGKKRMATREREKTFQQSQNYQLPTEYREAYRSALQQENVGLPSAALGLFNQSAGRQQASQLSALRGRRSLLGGIGQVAQAGQDSALKLAGMQAEALQQGKRYADQMRMKMGQLEQGEAMRKLDEAAQYRDVQRMESDRAIGSALQGIGSAIGTASMAQAYGGGSQGMTPDQRNAMRAFQKMKNKGITSNGWGQ